MLVKLKLIYLYYLMGEGNDHVNDYFLGNIINTPRSHRLLFDRIWPCLYCDHTIYGVCTAYKYVTINSSNH
jgi:hypothetical protein